MFKTVLFLMAILVSTCGTSPSAKVQQNDTTTAAGEGEELITHTVSGVKIGDKAPNFAAKTPDGKDLSLFDVLDQEGKVTIIEFWASWCPYCRAELPNVVKIYEKYHNRGLNIIGVSIDENKKDWTGAIDEFGMNWPQVSNLSQWNDPIVELYGVESIPNNFILDQDGKVVAIKLKGEELEAKIAELLGEE